MKHDVPPAGGIPLAFARTPFARDVFKTTAPYGLTIEEYLPYVVGLPSRFWEEGIVCANFELNKKAYSEPVPREMWAYVSCTWNGVQVSLTMHLPMGNFGGGGNSSSESGSSGKGALGLVASIALIAATSAISGGALAIPATAAFGGGLFAAGSVSAALLSAGVGIVGALALTALSAPPSLEAIEEGKDRESGNASASGNIIAPGGVIPRVVGGFRYPPMLACQPLIDIRRDDQVAEAVYVMSGPHSWRDIQNNGVPIDEDEDIEYETRRGFDADDALEVVTRTGFTVAPARELTDYEIDLESGQDLVDQGTPGQSTPRWNLFTSRRGPDEFWMMLYWPEGMLFADAPDDKMGIPVRVRMRPRGGGAWLNFPEIHFEWRGGSAFRKMIKIKWSANPNGGSPVTPLDEFAPVYAFKEVPVQDVDPIGLGGWTASDRFSAGPGHDLFSAATVLTSNVRNVGLFYDRVEFYVGEGFEGLDAGEGELEGLAAAQTAWDVQIKRGMPYAFDSFTPGTYIYSGDTHDFFGYHEDGGGVAQVLSSYQNARKTIVLASHSTVKNQLPVKLGSGLAILAIKARNKALQNVTALLHGLVPDFNGTNWAGAVETSNPAAHYRYTLRGAVNANPLPVGLLDNDAFESWWRRCNQEGFECNMVADGRNLDVLQKVIAGCGYALPRQSEIWGVTQDRDRAAEGIVQMFNPRNLQGFRMDVAFPLLPHGFRVHFKDETLDFQDGQEFIVYDEGYSSGGADDTIAATRLVDVTYDGLTTTEAARRRAQFDLAQARLRAAFYSMSVDAEALVSTKGDLVGVQHDVLTRTAGFARVKEKVLDDEDRVAGLILDAKIPTRMAEDFFTLADVFSTPDIFGLSGTTGVAIRLQNGVGIFINQELSDPVGYTDEITFVDPFEDPGDDLTQDCLVSTGEFGSEYGRYVIADVTPGPKMTAALTLVDEAPALWPALSQAVQDVNDINVKDVNGSTVFDAG